MKTSSILVGSVVAAVVCGARAGDPITLDNYETPGLATGIVGPGIMGERRVSVGCGALYPATCSMEGTRIDGDGMLHIRLEWASNCSSSSTGHTHSLDVIGGRFPPLDISTRPLLLRVSGSGFVALTGQAACLVTLEGYEADDGVSFSGGFGLLPAGVTPLGTFEIPIMGAPHCLTDLDKWMIRISAHADCGGWGEGTGLLIYDVEDVSLVELPERPCLGNIAACGEDFRVDGDDLGALLASWGLAPARATLTSTATAPSMELTSAFCWATGARARTEHPHLEGDSP